MYDLIVTGAGPGGLEAAVSEALREAILRIQLGAELNA